MTSQREGQLRLSQRITPQRGVARTPREKLATRWTARSASMLSPRLWVGMPSPLRPRGCMAAFPDLEVIMDNIVVDGDQTVYCWTLVGTNTGPGGTGKRVHISGFEEWRMGADGLVGES